MHQTIPRNLSSKHKKQVDKFIQALDKGKQIPILLQRIKELQNNENWTQSEHDKLETIDKEFTAVLLKAEQKCAKPHNAPWHPALHQSYLIFTYWRIVTSGKANRKSTKFQLRQILKQLQEAPTPANDIYQDEKQRSPFHQLKMAKAKLKEQRREARQKRNEFLTFQQEIKVLEGKKVLADAIATIQRAETRAKKFKKYHVYTKPPKSANGLLYILKEEQDSIKRIQDRDELENELFHRNRTHFAQAQNTPFVQEPLTNYLGYSGTTSMSEDIMQGKPLPDDIPETAKAVLTELNRVREEISSEMSFESMVNGSRIEGYNKSILRH
jgi:hypothetical protein